jgi:hypothetical protein
LLLIGSLFTGTVAHAEVESPVQQDSNGKYIQRVDGTKIYEKDITTYQLPIVKKEGNNNIVNIRGELYGFYSANDNDYQIGDVIQFTFKDGEITNVKNVDTVYKGVITNVYDFQNGNVFIEFKANNRIYKTIGAYEGYNVGDTVNAYINNKYSDIVDKIQLAERAQALDPQTNNTQQQEVNKDINLFNKVV